MQTLGEIRPKNVVEKTLFPAIGAEKQPTSPAFVAKHRTNPFIPHENASDALTRGNSARQVLCHSILCLEAYLRMKPSSRQPSHSTSTIWKDRTRVLKRQNSWTTAKIPRLPCDEFFYRISGVPRGAGTSRFRRPRPGDAGQSSHRPIRCADVRGCNIRGTRSPHSAAAPLC